MAEVNLGRLKVTIGADTKEIDRSVKRTRRSLDGMARAVRNAFAFGAVAVGTQQLVRHTQRAVQSLDAIGKTADRIGVSTKALQELRFAASQTGVETKALEMALQRFVRRSAEAANGTGEAEDALARLGVQLRDNEGRMRSAEDLLSDVADGLAEVEDQSQRVALAQKLFDSEGVAFLNTLQRGSGALAGMREEARKAGIVIEESVIRKAERMNDKLDKSQRIIDAQLKTALLNLAPALQTAAQGMADFTGWLGRGVRAAQELVLMNDENVRVFRELANKQKQLAGLPEILRKMEEAGATGTKEYQRLLVAASTLSGEITMLKRKAQAFKDQAAEIFGIGGQGDRPELGPAGGGVPGDEEGGGAGQAGGLPPDLQMRLDAFKNLQFKEIEALREATQKKHEILLEAFQNELISREEFNAEREDLERSYHDRVIRMAEEAAHRQRMIETTLARQKAAVQSRAASVATGFLNDLVAAAGASAKAQFAIAKALSLAEAFVNMQVGMTLARATNPFPMGEIIAAHIRTMGLINMAAIAGSALTGALAGGGGGGGAAGAGGGGGAAAAQQAPQAGTQQSLVVEGVTPDTIMSGADARMLAEKLLEFQKDGGKIVWAG